MTNAISEDLLSRLSAFVASSLGLHFPPSRWSDLEGMIRSGSKEQEVSGLESFIRRLLSPAGTKELTELAVNHLTNGESYFWREPLVFNALEEWIVPELIHLRGSEHKRLRIWSAGCSTGEEPYSIAIALRRALPKIDDWDITILATDINPRMLRTAVTGQYGEWSFRNAPSWLRARFFLPISGKAGKCEILPEIKRMISFAYLNLANDIFPSPVNDTNAMDIIFCRNVLMYFSPEHANRIVHKLHCALVDGGWLITSASELSQLFFSKFTTVQLPEAIVYRKSLDSPRSTEADPPKPSRAKNLPVEQPPRSLAIDLNSNATKEIPEQEVPRGIATLARKLADRGKLSDALAMCEEAIARDKLDPELHYLQALILQELNRVDEAFASIQRALYLDPGFILAHFIMGNLALRRGDIRTVKRCFENVLDLLIDHSDEEMLPQSEGLTAGWLRQIVQETIKIGA